MAAAKGLTTFACVLGVLTPLLWFASLVTPGEEAVKIRNGLVAELTRMSRLLLVRTWSGPPGAKNAL